ncbi:MAG: cupredoxin domain-containing protein [Candidatus Woesebacteria bacterium]|nr:cupredoxin domain-containing protein [Candidatus Woesebacteria bacterium]
MTLDKLLLSIGGGFLVVFIYWFFFGKKEEVLEAGDRVDIIVDGGYKPSVIKIKKNQKTKISLLRKDENSCLEEFIFPDFKIKKYLPLNEKVEIEITSTKVGMFKFHCGMNMFNGKVIVE